jgi:hypothetical protein
LSQIACTQLLQLASSLSPSWQRSWAQPPGALDAAGPGNETGAPFIVSVALPLPTTMKLYGSVYDGTNSPSQIAENAGP